MEGDDHRDVRVCKRLEDLLTRDADQDRADVASVALLLHERIHALDGAAVYDLVLKLNRFLCEDVVKRAVLALYKSCVVLAVLLDGCGIYARYDRGIDLHAGLTEERNVGDLLGVRLHCHALRGSVGKHLHVVKEAKHHVIREGLYADATDAHGVVADRLRFLILDLVGEDELRCIRSCRERDLRSRYAVGLQKHRVYLGVVLLQFGHALASEEILRLKRECVLGMLLEKLCDLRLGVVLFRHLLSRRDDLIKRRGVCRKVGAKRSVKVEYVLVRHRFFALKRERRRVGVDCLDERVPSLLRRFSLLAVDEVLRPCLEVVALGFDEAHLASGLKAVLCEDRVDRCDLGGREVNLLARTDDSVEHLRECYALLADGREVYVQLILAVIDEGGDDKLVGLGVVLDLRVAPLAEVVERRAELLKILGDGVNLVQGAINVRLTKFGILAERVLKDLSSRQDDFLAVNVYLDALLLVGGDVVGDLTVALGADDLAV